MKNGIPSVFMRAQLLIRRIIGLLMFFVAGLVWVLAAIFSWECRRLMFEVAVTGGIFMLIPYIGSLHIAIEQLLARAKDSKPSN